MASIDKNNFFKTIYQRAPEVAETIKQKADNEPSFAGWMIPKGEPKKVFDDKRFLVKRSAGSQVVPDEPLGLGVTYGDTDSRISVAENTRNAGSSTESALGCNEITALNTVYPEGNCVSPRAIINANGGYFERIGEDRKIKAGTTVNCLNDLEGFTTENQLEILGDEFSVLEDSLLRSKEWSVMQHVAKTAESNFVCKGRLNPAGERPKFTGPNGWERVDDEEVDHVTIFHLLEVRERIGTQKINHKKIRSLDGFVLKVSMTQEAWDCAVMRYENVMESSVGTYRNNDVYAQSSLARYQKTTRTAVDVAMGKNTKTTELWNGKIQVFFTDNPLKAYQVPDGQFPDGSPRSRFEPIPRFIDVDARTVHGEDSRGIIQIENPQWRENFYFRDGIRYEVFEAITIIDEESWKWHPLLRGVRPNGMTSTPVDLTINIKHGADIPPITGCPNEDDTQYYYFAEWWTRYINRYPEFSGIGWHRPARMLGFNSGMTFTDSNKNDVQPTAAVDLADAEACEKEGDCVQEGEDEATCEVTDNLTRLDPCGSDVTAPYFGEGAENIVTLNVIRDSACASVGAASVDFALTPIAADAARAIVESVYGVDYEVINDAGVAQAATGTVDFEAGESGTKSIRVRLLGAAADATKFKAFTLTVSDETGTTLEDCDSVDVLIENAQ